MSRGALPAAISVAGLDQQSGPSSASRSSNSPAVSSGPIGVALAEDDVAGVHALIHKKVVTPVSVSPLMIAQLTGATPRYLGRSEAWRLTQPSARQREGPAPEDPAVGRRDYEIGLEAVEDVQERRQR